MANTSNKAGLSKRASAFFIDAVLLLLLAVALAYVLSLAFGYSRFSQAYSSGIERYAAQYNVQFDKVVSQADFDALTDQQKAAYEAAVAAMNEDTEILDALSSMVRLIFLIAALSLFLAFLALEFIVPLFLKQGRTLGKKAFGLSVTKKDGSPLGPVPLLVRTFVGKYLIETMIPVLIIIITIFNAIGLMNGPGIIGFAIILVIVISNLALVFISANGCAIHDHIADTIVVSSDSAG
ncbi:MAG: RDD family protein [Spirochaetales bacterium]|nr:RDD family protein [Spirochaetales bacterium]